jgi:hypothetical protein
MRLSLLAALVALALLAPTASARIAPPATGPVTQNLSSPDAQDANAAGNAQSLSDLAHRHSKIAAALAQEKYYSSYGRATTQHTAPADDDAPLLTIVLGLGLTFLVAGAVTMTVRSRRRVRVAV